ncbi:hypothetical protein DID88_005817 [Monilinia fructigena]|uniref:Uncharacterized protein n=1 Tax=Monilinia fructigena TaxID=38457 RepID=A0A395J0U7_9HELO|nr:hypothetical protein DID88_005817 [Monilinia fructigena]
MASMNNTFSGKSPIFANGESLHEHQGKLSGCEDLRPGYPANFDKHVTYNHSVTQGQISPGSRPNQYENNPGISLSNGHANNGPSWTPTQLLNPRSSNQIQQASPHSQSKFAQPAPSPQPIFQFDTPGGSHTPAPLSNITLNVNLNVNGQNGFASYANGNGQMPSMGTPKNRIPAGEGSRTQFNGGSSGGAYGQYVKDKRVEGQKEGGNTPVLDLCTEDEVEVLGNEQDREVCYGRIEGATLNAHRVPTAKKGTQTLTPENWAQVKIVLKRKDGDRTNNIHATDVTREIVGCVDINTAIGLAPILDSPRMGLRLSMIRKTGPKQRPSQSDARAQPATKSGKAASQPKVEPATLALNCKTTLLVAPLSVVSNWEDQIKAHVKPGALKYYIYHGANRIKDVKKLSEYDVVITTYGSVASECNNRNKKKDGKYPLEEMNWFRIVLDEAHMIREQSTLQFKAICRLSAQRRWACTGTPVQNRLEDLGALMSFLRVKPFDGSGFAQHILSPFKLCDPEIIPKLRLLVDSITLRRLKDKIDLPKRHDQIARLDFSDEERMVYDIFEKNATDRLKVITSQGESALGGKTFHHILQSILRLRQVCAHGKDLLSAEDLKIMNGLSKDSAIDLDSEEYEDHDGMTPKQAYDMFKLMKETGADSCLLCNRKMGAQNVDPDGESKDEVIGYMTPCFHIICGLCIGGYKSQLEEMAFGGSLVGCPTCRQPISPSVFSLKQEEIDKEEESRLKTKESAKAGKDLSNYSGPHTKTMALIHDLLESRKISESRPDEPPIKSVVFSGWTTHLDLIQFALQDNNIAYTRLDGKMSRASRSVAMEKFREDPTIVVILVSIAAGGLGLNLTTANKVYVMEPQFNPAAEAQAIDRVHRLGQKREVQTVRFIMNKSFEEKMFENSRQETKSWPA